MEQLLMTSDEFLGSKVLLGLRQEFFFHLIPKINSQSPK
jgi:hypothetical protein